MTEQEKRKLVHAYGHAVYARDIYDKVGAVRSFQQWDAECLRLWNTMKREGVYADDEGSTLKDEYRPYYYAGLNGEIMPQEQAE